MMYQKTLETQETKLGTLYVYNIWDILKYFYIYFMALTVSINTPSKFNNTYPQKKKKLVKFKKISIYLNILGVRVYWRESYS